MSLQRILALSSSKVGNAGFLEHPAPIIKKFLGEKPLNIAFIGFAAADNDYDSYALKVRTAFADSPHNIQTVNPSNAIKAVEQADVIMVGGGNTFKLLHHLYHYQLIKIIHKKVNEGTSYIGWSAGANITGLTLSTTNDMPIIEPESFKALGFFPFQINPHYHNQVTTGFNGETRNQRLAEFLLVNPGIPVVGLPEGTALHSENGITTFIGTPNGVLFHANERKEITDGENLSGLAEVGE